MPSLYDVPPDTHRSVDLLADYERHLAARNGDLWSPGGFERRDRDMASLAAASQKARYRGDIDKDVFERMYAKFEPGVTDDPHVLAMLAFVKVNAAEAYGVEVTTAAREKFLDPDNPLMRMEKVLAREEQYHTRLLCGVTDHVWTFESLSC